MGRVTVCLLVIITCTGLTQAAITCKDNLGAPVDWFVVYKLPRDNDSPYPLVAKGIGHYYLDVNHQEWTMGKKSLNDTGHALYHTINQVYKNYNSTDVAYLLYNDETPEKRVSFDHGHSKGDVVFDAESGYWLVHSLPRFPPYANSSYAYPHSGLPYGQTFLCVTYPAKLFNQIGLQMLYNFPWVYDSNLPSDLATANPNLAKVIKVKHVKKAPWNHRAELISSGSQKFISFAKYCDWGKDLYDAWIAPYFESEVNTETWQNGPGKLHSNCTAEYKVLNIVQMKVGDVPFPETHDHAKWAITTGSHQWICIGDINRAETQKGRAGGTVCAHLPAVWKAFSSSITKLEQCSKSRRKHKDNSLKRLVNSKQNTLGRWV